MKRTSRDIRLQNCFEVLRHILARPPVSRQQLAAATGLSMATVSNLVSDLVMMGVVAEVGYEESGGGRPRALLAPDTSGGLLVGVDVAETYVHVEVYDQALSVLADAEEELGASEDTPGQIIGHIVSTLAGVAGGQRRRVLGVGVSVPGQVDAEGGVSVFAPNWSWHDVPLRGELTAALRDAGLDLPVYLDNPLKAAMLAELWFGAGRGASEAVVINLGTGVGAGLAVGGRLYRGVTDSAGEWGHTTLVVDGRPCRCGNRGCVEAYLGAPGIMAQLRELAPDSAMLRRDDQVATIRALAEACASGDAIALKVVAEAARYLAAGMANLVNLLNPEALVVRGWVAAELGQWMLDEAHRALPSYALARPLSNVTISLGDMSRNVVCLGAATVALERYLDSIGTASGATKARKAAR